jgi:hypothetical protein
VWIPNNNMNAMVTLLCLSIKCSFVDEPLVNSYG